jgi:lipopolysaccharide biosynthesis glycosyltransferase
MMDSGFITGFKGTMLSLLKSNSNFEVPLIVLDNGLKDTDKSLMMNLYPFIIFREIPKGKYHFSEDSAVKKLINTYYKLEMFNRGIYPDNADRAVFLDMDILIQGNIKPLLDFDLQGKKIGACKQYSVREDTLIEDINSGIIVVDLNKITEQDYTNLVSMCEKGSHLPDQTIINDYFIHENEYLAYLPKTYNVEKRMVVSQKYKNIYEQATIIHYVNTKPWEPEARLDKVHLPVYEKWWNLLESRTVIDIPDELLSFEELNYLIEKAVKKEGILRGKGGVMRMDSNLGRLVSLILRKPIETNQGWEYHFKEEKDKPKLKEMRFHEPMKEEFYESMFRNKRVIFVGPSPIMNGRKLGEFIDSFDVVIRTNNMMNTLLDNPLLYEDYGRRTDILYVNVTYERDAYKEWRVREWKEQGLQVICKMMHSNPKNPLLVNWRNIPNRLPEVPPPTLFIGTRLIHEILQYDFKEFYITGIDAYADIPNVITGENAEYIQGYLPEFTVRQRERHL